MEYPSDVIERRVGRLAGIARRKFPRAPMETLSQALITPAAGVEDDIRGRWGRRQVTLMSQQAWTAACEELAVALPWIVRRANLLLDGIDLEHTAGSLLSIGDVMLGITGENPPCWRMDEQCEGLGRALSPGWRAGTACIVLEPGLVRVGDQATLHLRPVPARMLS